MQCVIYMMGQTDTLRQNKHQKALFYLMIFSPTSTFKDNSYVRYGGYQRVTCARFNVPFPQWYFSKAHQLQICLFCLSAYMCLVCLRVPIQTYLAF